MPLEKFLNTPERRAPLTSQEWPVISRTALLIPGITLLFSRSAFLFLKNALLFSRIPFNFPEGPFFIYCAQSFFKNAFFHSWFYFLLVLLRAAETDICLALVLFLLGTLYWPTCDTFLITLIPLHGVGPFMYFLQILVFMITWKMQFLSVLEWMKFQVF